MTRIAIVDDSRLVRAFVAGALRGIGLDLAFTITGQDEAYSPPSRILVSSVIFALWLTLIGGLLSAWSRYQRQRQDMLDEYLTRQLQLRLLDPDRSGVLGDDTVRRLDDMTAAVQEELSGADAASHADYGQLSASLKAVIDERMRPLLHQMWFAEEPGAVADPSTKSFLVRSLLTPVPLGWALGVYGVTVFVAGMISIGVGLGWVAAAIEFSALALTVVHGSFREQPIRIRFAAIFAVSRFERIRSNCNVTIWGSIRGALYQDAAGRGASAKPWRGAALGADVT